ncbi:MAG: Alanine-tRNA ligase [candidate division TM6 bacterium GW2011_GWF2_28_16]|nr:MAG: Alanine-tRNA ligase [candidate division TM6 bacterium GW2011_GWF2_28_16]
MNSMEIREKFLNYFKKNGHEIVSSSSLIPAQDPTLLFTNAGMNQFKDLFLGNEKRNYKTASTIQKCVRAGGKHNDLEEVGFTNRHLTFFEMMGNFSFGDYFKQEAIKYAWEFLTKEVKINPDNLKITIYKDDNEAYKIWHETIGISSDKIYRLGEKENFWQMGDTGPCGPCTEIHFDNGKDVGCKKETCDPSCSCGRFTEIWNLVFMQFNRQPDGVLVPLKQTGIDTGMGFERLNMILQKKDSVFQTEIFAPIIKKIEDLTKLSYNKSDKNTRAAFHVLCDHVRSSSLLIADGCLPSNEGRGYVLRKIIRRAALFAQKLSDNPKLFSSLSKEFISYFSLIYKELKDNEKLIIATLDDEITKFSENLKQGKVILEKYIQENKNNNKNYLTGEQVFKLYDTYGFPTELTKVVANEQNFTLDMPSFDAEMEKQKEQSGKKTKDKIITLDIPEDITTKFVGYDKLELDTEINFILKQDDYIWLVTKESPFYVESGGQVSDKGFLNIDNNIHKIEEFYKANNTNNPAIAVKIKNNNLNLKINNKIKCIVDFYSRTITAKNHTATHLLQTALIQILGKHIQQAGSFVNSEFLRFDYTSNHGLTKQDTIKIENIVNQKIQENIALNIFHTTLQEARNQGVTALFGEKYNPEQVRVVQVPGFSAELCGGTHVKNTGDIGLFKIESDVALSSGVRRITGLTGPKAIELFQNNFDTVKTLVEKFKVKPEQVLNAIEKQEENMNNLNSQIKQLKKQISKANIPTWQNSVTHINKIPFLFLKLQDFDNTQIKEICETIETKSPGFYFIININTQTPDIISFMGYLSKIFTDQVNLKEFSKNILQDKFNLKGGGSNNLIQGGGNKPENIEQEIINWLKAI